MLFRKHFTFQTFCIGFIVLSASGQSTILQGPPSSLSVITNDTFSISMEVNNANAIRSAAFDIVYNPTVLQLRTITEGSALNFDGAQTAITSSFDNTAGVAIVGISRLAPAHGVTYTGSKSLARISFRAIGQVNTTIATAHEGFLDDSGKGLIFSKANLPVNIVIQNTPRPHYSIVSDHDSVRIGQHSFISICLDTCRSLHGVAFDLIYDSLLFKYTGVKEEVFMSENNTHPALLNISKVAGQGRLIVGYSRQGQLEGLSIDSVQRLLTFEFTATKPGSGTFALENAGLFLLEGSVLTLSQPQPNSMVTVIDHATVSRSAIPIVNFSGLQTRYTSDGRLTFNINNQAGGVIDIYTTSGKKVKALRNSSNLGGYFTIHGNTEQCRSLLSSSRFLWAIVKIGHDVQTVPLILIR